MLVTQVFPNSVNLKKLLWIDMNGWYMYSGTPLLQKVQTPLLTDILHYVDWFFGSISTWTGWNSLNNTNTYMSLMQHCYCCCSIQWLDISLALVHTVLFDYKVLPQTYSRGELWNTAFYHSTAQVRTCLLECTWSLKLSKRYSVHRTVSFPAHSFASLA